MSALEDAGTRHMCSAPLAYSVAGAAAATGISETLIRDALRTGWIPRHYLNTKVVILATDLISWLSALPAVPNRKPNATTG